MKPQIPLGDEARAHEQIEAGLHEVAPDLAYQRHAIVNVAYFGLPGAGSRLWTLIDAGIAGSAAPIRRAAGERFGEHAPPAAIILTHGHFDHVGAVRALAEEWNAPVYAHPLEIPYLDGSEKYPPPDPTAGGSMSLLSPLFPRGPIDLNRLGLLQTLPTDGSIPHMPGWRWIHTPGHTRGHISLWRESDRTLIAGDAFITTRQESAYAAMTQKPEMHGPPRYFTPDWDAARDSVRTLAALEPELVVTGHGRAMRGQTMRDALHALAERFDEVAVPESAKTRR